MIPIIETPPAILETIEVQGTNELAKDLIKVEFFGGNPGFKLAEYFYFPIFKNIRGWRKRFNIISFGWLFPQAREFKVKILQPDYMIARETKRG